MEISTKTSHSQPFAALKKVSVKSRLEQVSLTFDGPGVTVLMGSNGAGKSTLLSLLAGEQRAMEGVFSCSSHFQGRDLAYLPEPVAFYDHLTVEEHLSFHANRFGLLPMNVKQAIDGWQLNEVADKKTQHLSLGFRQRLALAQVAMQRPKVMLLDEPMNGMDPELMALFKGQLSEWKSYCCIVLASHLLDQVDDLADHWVVMSAGEVVGKGELSTEDPKNLYQIYQQQMQQGGMK